MINANHKYAHISQDKIDRIVEMCRDGQYTQSEIAKTVGVDGGTVRLWRDRYGIKPTHKSTKGVPLTDERKKAIESMIAAGATYSEIIEKLKCGASTISRIAHDMKNRHESEPEPNYIVTVELSDEGGTHFIKEIRVHAEYRNDAIKAATEELRQTGYGSYWKLFKSVVELSSTHEDEPVVEEVEPKYEKTERMTEEKKPMSRKAPSVVITKRTIELTGSHTGIGWTLTIQDGKIKMAADRAVEIALDDVAGFTEEMLELLSMVDNG